MNPFDYVNDPITGEQVDTLKRLLGDEWTDKARDGFLVISGRFVDETSTDRTAELRPLFKTETPQGRKALKDSLESLLDTVGSLQKFDADYPVYINDPVHGSVGLFPQLRIVGVHNIHSELYRLFDTNAVVYGSAPKEKVRDYILRTGKLPLVNPPEALVLRKKPYMYWCSHQKYASPQESRAALQILDRWNSDCRLRATLPAAPLEGQVFVAYSGVTEYPPDVINIPQTHVFAGYNVELETSDHPELPGGGLQVGIVGEPVVTKLEEWRDDLNNWTVVWPSEP